MSHVTVFQTHRLTCWSVSRTDAFCGLAHRTKALLCLFMEFNGSNWSISVLIDSVLNELTLPWTREWRMSLNRHCDRAVVYSERERCEHRITLYTGKSFWCFKFFLRHPSLAGLKAKAVHSLLNRLFFSFFSFILIFTLLIF